MRAHWVSSLALCDDYILKDESLHHLVNVVRMKVGENLLLLNGQGLAVETLVEGISKREIKLKKISHLQHERPFHFDLALGMPKREALELSLKQATELGFRKIYLIKSDYSQMKYPERDRTESVLVSALEQSNAPFLPEVVTLPWKDIPWGQYAQAWLLDSQTKTGREERAKTQGESHLLIVGPEGGFSPLELTYLHSCQEVRVVHLPTPILRTPTAIAAGAGMMIENLLK